MTTIGFSRSKSASYATQDLLSATVEESRVLVTRTPLQPISILDRCALWGEIDERVDEPRPLKF
jgi:hypothetical protein